MASGDDFWVFQVPNLILAAAMYTLLGRFQPDSDKVIWRVFAQVTDPIVRGVGFLTPQVVPDRLIVLLAVVWVFLARILLFFILRSYGLISPVAG
jgi:YggT family protein